MRASTAQVCYHNRPRRYTPEYKLYFKEVHFIVAVGPDGTPTMNEMAQRLKVTQGAVTQIASQLEKKGYLIRTKDTTDRRCTTISLTEKGKELCAKHIAYDQEKYQEASDFFSDYSDEQLAFCIHFQERMLEMYTILE